MKDDARRPDTPFGEPAEVASATECTGLMPALNADDAADANSDALLGIHDAKGSRKKQYRKK